MLYDIGFLIFSLFYLPALLFKGKLHGDFSERFGVYSAEKRSSLERSKGAIWIQAVSVGEVALLKSFIPLLRQRYPSTPIVLSTITSSGNDLARRLFSKDAVIIYFPLDFSFIVKRVLDLVRPRLYVMVETEIWPNFLRRVSASSIPAALINGRISDRSFGKYRLARPFIKDILARIDSFCMQSDVDACRIISLGAPKNKVTVTGSMKFDITASFDEKGASYLMSCLGLASGDELLVAGSTHRGEEEIIADLFSELKMEFPFLRLLIAPRHIERAGEVESAVKRSGLIPMRVSCLNEQRRTLNEQRIFILDIIGCLSDAYMIAALVFVGGSLVKHGGQNPIEPAALGKPVIFGPHMFNFKNIAEALLKGEGAVQVNDADGLKEAFRIFLKDSARRKTFGNNALDVIKRNRGATRKNLEALEKLIADS